MQRDPRTDSFIRHLTGFQSRLYAYILSLTADPNVAADVLQETNVVLWHKSEEFTEGTSFASWALHVAYLQTLAARQKRSRERLVFDDAMLKGLADDAAAVYIDLDDRQKALHTCLESLSERQRDLLSLHYESNLTISAIADRVQLKPNAVTQAMHRIRVRLMNCINSRLAGGAHP
ncbi:MAG: sigma-70 family RNA polymerase sigma factor [Planctomycetes bacterium]|nr:sigma-70 family RNA polymerase sigma factor [Planctomycetota bacterium]